MNCLLMFPGRRRPELERAARPALSLHLEATSVERALRPRSSHPACPAAQGRPTGDLTGMPPPTAAYWTRETALDTPDIDSVRLRDESDDIRSDRRATSGAPACSMGRRGWLAAAFTSALRAVGPLRSLAIGSWASSASTVAMATVTGLVGTAAAQSRVALREAMQRAQALRDEAVRSGDQAYGAVVLRGDEIVGAAPSRVLIATDPTAHAEMEAIRDAARRLRSRDLSGCVLVSTSRPCRMCEGAAMWAGISRMLYGDTLTDAGAPR
jgi:tRNA(Arg) A34 adenosine deaminase TadA